MTKIKLHKRNLTNASVQQTLQELRDNERVTEIDLRYNKLTEVPDLSQFTNLTTLRLQHNKITQVNKSHLPVSVTEINLSYNKLTEVPDLSQFTNLTILSLRKNKITQVNKLHLPVCVTYIYLSWNKVTEVPDLSQFTNLTTLSLLNNPVRTILGLPLSLTDIRLPDTVQVLGVKCFHPNTIKLLQGKYFLSLQQPPREVLLRGLEAVKLYYGEKPEEERHLHDITATYKPPHSGLDVLPGPEKDLSKSDFPHYPKSLKHSDDSSSSSLLDDLTTKPSLPTQDKSQASDDSPISKTDTGNDAVTSEHSATQPALHEQPPEVDTEDNSDSESSDSTTDTESLQEYSEVQSESDSKQITSAFHELSKQILSYKQEDRTWFSHCYPEKGKIKLGYKPGCEEKARDFITQSNLSQDQIDFEEGCFKFQAKYTLNKGSKIKSVVPICICALLKSEQNLEMACIDNRGYGTLTCFAKKKGPNPNGPFALEQMNYGVITAQHVLNKTPRKEKRKNRYILSEVKHKPIMLSTCSNGLLSRVVEDNKSIDIAILTLSHNLSKHRLSLKDKITVGEVQFGKKVSKIGCETKKTTGKVIAEEVLVDFEGVTTGYGFLVESDTENPHFSQSGDSGALIIQNKKAIGILQGGIIKTKRPRTVGSRLNCCLQAVREEFGEDYDLYSSLVIDAPEGHTWYSPEDVRPEHCCCNTNR